MTGNKKKTRVTLDAEFEGEVVRGGVRIEFNANGGVDVYAPVPVIVHPAVNDSPPPSAAKAEPQIGDIMPDGMKYAGTSPTTGRPFYVDAVDAPGLSGLYTFPEAQDYAERRGRKRLPTASELNVLFNNRAAIGGFKEGISRDVASYYWSSTPGYYGQPRAQSFRDGQQFSAYLDLGASLRLVRD